METEANLNALIANLNSVDADFVDDNNIPPWALLLIQSMKGLFNFIY